jgi:hypothetical protein
MHNVVITLLPDVASQSCLHADFHSATYMYMYIPYCIYMYIIYRYVHYMYIFNNQINVVM